EESIELGQRLLVERVVAEYLDQQIMVEGVSEHRSLTDDAPAGLGEAIDLAGRDGVESLGQGVEARRAGHAEELLEEQWVAGGSPHDLVAFLGPKRLADRGGVDEITEGRVVDGLERNVDAHERGVDPAGHGTSCDDN